MFEDISSEGINEVMQRAWMAFHQYRKFSLQQRAGFMKAIALQLEATGDELIRTAMEETHLPEARLKNERNRTIFQLNSYADACAKGEWLEARIDTANPDRNPPKPDIRKMLVPLGPVVVFGASNFPFAYSTAGGDTACALAAGCPVIVKAHPAHARTSEAVAEAILKAAASTGMPDGIFAHVHSKGFEGGKQLVQHKYTKAVGFTGSFAGGKALFDIANEREEPIPVFAEMGSINPVLLFPEKLSEYAEAIAKDYAGSITLGVGQFCTNPGLIIGIESEDLNLFIRKLGEEIKELPPATMLHTGIFNSYVENRANALTQGEVETVAISEKESAANQGLPTVASAPGVAFLNNPVLHKEVFGPYSLVIKCADAAEMLEVVKHCEGQLTTTLIATQDDLRTHAAIVEAAQDICGRFILNGVPTGVEVCLAMQHGGPYPASTDSRFTSVGADGIKRFARPLSYQNWPDSLLPPELQDANPLGIWRTVNNSLEK